MLTKALCVIYFINLVGMLHGKNWIDLMKPWFRIIDLNKIVSSSKIAPIQHIEEIPEHHLQQDIYDFIDLVPVEEIKNLTIYFYANDEEMRNSYDFLVGEDYTRISNELWNLKEMKSLSKFFNESGVRFDKLMQRFKAFSISEDELEAVTGEFSFQMCWEETKFKLIF